MPDTLPPGKVRALQSNATPSGVFTILALDHRDSLRVMLDPKAPDDVPATRLTELKLAITRRLAPLASAVMLDPEYGAAQAINAHALPGQVGLVCALEEQGYLGDPYSQQQTLLTGWTVEKAKRLGATAVKVLLMYHPDAGAVSVKQEALVRAVVADCRRHEIPLFLEPIGYSLRPEEKDSPAFADDRRRIVVESARRLGALGADILKLQFPVEANHELDRSGWGEACAELDEASPVPWVLLSAGEPFDVFRAQLEVACQAGCSGFLAGRAIWREVIALHDADLDRFITATARQRFEELAAIAEKYALPWHKRYTLLEVDERWYLEY